MKFHLGIDVYNLEKSLDFYAQVVGANIDFVNTEQRWACLSIGGSELNLFEQKGFGGYHKSLLLSLHIGFQLNTREQVDYIYDQAKNIIGVVNAKPFKRSDGDYSLFLNDPDGMHIEFYFGDHTEERST